MTVSKIAIPRSNNTSIPTIDNYSTNTTHLVDTLFISLTSFPEILVAYAVMDIIIYNYCWTAS